MTVDEEDAPPPRGPLRRALRVLAVIGLLGVVASVVGTVALLFPYFRDDMKVDRIVRAVALDWRDFGIDKAGERFELELKAEGVGPQVGDEDCRFSKKPDGTREVSCVWGIVLNVPGGLDVPIRFESHAAIDPSGELR